MRLRKSSTKQQRASVFVFCFTFAIVIIYIRKLKSATFRSLSSSFDTGIVDRWYKKDANNSQINEYQTTYEDRIFMHETSGRSYLLWRQICSLESIARSNLDRTIQLYMSTSHISETQTPWMDIIRRFKNVEVILINNEQYFYGSPLYPWYQNGEWQVSPYETSHMSNYIRMLTLLRGGGLYMDLDVIVFKKLDSGRFRNFFLYRSEHMNSVDSSVFHLTTGHFLIKEIVDLIANDYDSDADTYHGSDAISKILKEFCKIKTGKPWSNRCSDITLLPHTYFYPIEKKDWKLLFQKPSPKFLENITTNYGIHIFSSVSNFITTKIGSPSLLSQLAQKYCPITVSKALLYNQKKI